MNTFIFFPQLWPLILASTQIIARTSTLATTIKAIDLPHYQIKVDPGEADREALVAAEIDVRDLTSLASVRQD